MILVLAAPAGAAGETPMPRLRPGLSPAAQTPASRDAASAKAPEKVGVSQPAREAADAPSDLAGAVPLSEIDKLRSPDEAARALREKIAVQKPAVAAARQTSDALAAETADLKRELVAAAAKVSALEGQKLRLSSSIARLSAENAMISKDFRRDRAAVTRQLAVLERLQHDMPPAMVLRSDDALNAARSAMLMGATLPRVYRRAAELAGRIRHIREVRRDLTARRGEAARNSARLAAARDETARLLAVKQLQAAAAAAQYGELKDDFDKVAREAASLQVLLDRIAALRARPAAKGWVSVGASPDAVPGLIRPVVGRAVVGRAVAGGGDGVGGKSAPGVSYVTISGAQVVAPADGAVRFAGPYQKNGLVLILEIANGYDVVLTGLGRIDVRLGDRVLAGEPIGRMPAPQGRQTRLYFELRHQGRGLSPAPYVDAG